MDYIFSLGRIKASDVARTLIVFVSVFGANGNIIEQGEALPAIVGTRYVFRARKQNDLIPGSVISVTVRDRPGNVSERDVFVKS